MPDTTSVDQSTYEIVVFGLREGATHDQLIETDPGLSRWMQAQPGFVDHKLINVGEGKYVDIVRWSSMEEASAAAELAESSPSCAPTFALIDMETVSIFHGSATQQTFAAVEAG